MDAIKPEVTQHRFNTCGMFSQLSDFHQQYLAGKHCLHLGHDSQTSRAHGWEHSPVIGHTSTSTAPAGAGSSGRLTNTVDYKLWLSPCQGYERPATHAQQTGVFHQQVFTPSQGTALNTASQHHKGDRQTQLVCYTREAGHLACETAQRSSSHGRALVWNDNVAGVFQQDTAASAWVVPAWPQDRDGCRLPQHQLIQSGTGVVFAAGYQMFAVPTLHQFGFNSSWMVPNTLCSGGQMSHRIDPVQGVALATGVTVTPEESPGCIAIDDKRRRSAQGIPSAVAKPVGDQCSQTRSKCLLKRASKDHKGPRKRSLCKCPFCKDKSHPRKKEHHMCHECGKIYCRASHLKIHIRGHRGEKPFICKMKGCGKSFGRSDMLQRHVRTHTDEKTHFCPVCTMGFGRKDHLYKHTKTHSKWRMQVDKAMVA